MDLEQMQHAPLNGTFYAGDLLFKPWHSTNYRTFTFWKQHELSVHVSKGS